MELFKKKSKGFGFITLAILMLLVIVCTYLFFELFKYHLSLVVQNTYDFNKYQDIPMTLYGLYVADTSNANGCDKLSSAQNCNITLVFEANRINFLSSPATSFMASLLNNYKNYISATGFLLSLGLNNLNPVSNNCDNSGCSSYDIGLEYPLPLIPNGNFQNNPSLLLTDFKFQIKG